MKNHVVPGRSRTALLAVPLALACAVSLAAVGTASPRLTSAQLAASNGVDLDVVTRLAPGSSMAAGATVHWTVSVKNSGTGAAHGVKVTSVPTNVDPATVRITESHVGTGTSSDGSGEIELNTLVPSSYRDISVSGTVRRGASGQVINKAWASSDEGGYDNSRSCVSNTSLARDTDSCDYLVSSIGSGAARTVAHPRLQVLTTLTTRNPVVAGQRATWRVTVKNVGHANANNAYVASAPANVRRGTVSIKSSPYPRTGTVSGSTAKVDLGTLVPSASRTITVSGIVNDPIQGRSATTKAWANSSENLGYRNTRACVNNNSLGTDTDSCDYRVATAQAAVSSVRIVQLRPTQVYPGAAMRWRMTIKNIGNVNASDVNIFATTTNTATSSPTPAISSSPYPRSGSYSNGVLKVNVGTLVPNAYRTITVTAKVPLGTTSNVINKAWTQWRQADRPYTYGYKNAAACQNNNSVYNDSDACDYVASRIILPPDHYNPGNGVRFSHPINSSRDSIRTHVLRAINSVPGGEQIRIATWSFRGERAYAKALVAAKRRGVSVQVVTASVNDGDGAWRTLVNGLGRRPHSGLNPPGGDRLSYAYECYASCRGSGGTMHSKYFLFSRVGNVRDVIMSTSANLTDFAVSGQWNHLSTVVGSAEAYGDLNRVFQQQRLDRHFATNMLDYRPVQPVWLTKILMFPLPGSKATKVRADPVMNLLNTVNCNNGGIRTRIRIGQYAWYQTRGDWLAAKVRRLWNQGCDVAIIYSITNNQVKNVLYSSSGRGRIPMRQSVVSTSDGTLTKYLHQKYIAISGNVRGRTNNYVTLTGSSNWADLSMASDEQMLEINNYNITAAYMNDFYKVWRERTSHMPSPNSTQPANVERLMGTGALRNADDN